MPSARVDPEALAAARLEIEHIDRSIACLIAARLEAAVRALQLRTSHGEGVTDPRQEHLVRERARGWATELGIPARLLDELYGALIEAGKARFAGGARSPESPGVNVLASGPGPRPARLGEAPDERVRTVSAPR